MYQSIKSFAKQFEFQPVIENSRALKKRSQYVFIGMGGSGLPGKLFNAWKCMPHLYVHQNYGLPALSHKELAQSIVICCSHSGSTEEVLEGYTAARKQGYALAVIATGGQLLEYARAHKVPYVQIPKDKIQPRMATGYTITALAALMRDAGALAELRALAQSLKSAAYEQKGKTLARSLYNHIPLIYASERNSQLALNWKIKFNETSKIPAFWNMFPELNHNEMTGFDSPLSAKPLSANIHCILLEDAQDNPRIQTRMRVLAALYRARGIPCAVVALKGASRLHKIFSSTLLADWTAYHLARMYGANPQDVPIVEEFKKHIAQKSHTVRQK